MLATKWPAGDGWQGEGLLTITNAYFFKAPSRELCQRTGGRNYGSGYVKAEQTNGPSSLIACL